MKIGKINEGKGITLIALVITIIVLLILAGVALSLVVGEDGITNRAITAAKTQDIAEAKEKLELLAASYAGDFYEAKYVTGDSKATSLGDYVASKFTEGTFEEDFTLAKDASNSRKITISSKNYSDNSATCTISDDGEVVWKGASQVKASWTQDGTTVTNGKVTLEVGSSVSGYNVTVPDSGSWCVLGAKDGKLLITTNKNVTTITLSGQDGYTNGVATLNSAAEAYDDGDMADDVWALNVYDVNRVTRYDPETADYGANELYQYKNEVTYYWDGTDYPYYSGSNGETGNLLNSHNTAFYYPTESGFTSSEKSNNATIDNKETITKLTSTIYYYQGDSGIDSNSSAYTLLFTNTGGYPGDTGSYWLCTSCVSCFPMYVGFGLDYVSFGCVDCFSLACSDGDENSRTMGLRPVVSLQSGIQIDKDGKITK